MLRCNTDLETWLHDFGDRVYRILEYRKPGQYTPYEVENKFRDESLFVENEYKHVVIEEVIELPDKDLLIGFRECFMEDDEEYSFGCSIEYYKLGDIKLECFATDQIGGEL